MQEHKKANTLDQYKKIGKRIAQIRTELNLSQMQLAAKLGIKQQVLAGYEIATRRIPISMLKPFADVLFTTVEDLLGLKMKGKPGPISKIDRRIEYIKSLPENKQMKIIEIIDALLEITTD